MYPSVCFTSLIQTQWQRLLLMGRCFCTHNILLHPNAYCYLYLTINLYLLLTPVLTSFCLIPSPHSSDSEISSLWGLGFPLGYRIKLQVCDSTTLSISPLQSEMFTATMQHKVLTSYFIWCYIGSLPENILSRYLYGTHHRGIWCLPKFNPS